MSREAAGGRLSSVGRSGMVFQLWCALEQGMKKKRFLEGRERKAQGGDKGNVKTTGLHCSYISTVWRVATGYCTALGRSEDFLTYHLFRLSCEIQVMRHFCCCIASAVAIASNCQNQIFHWTNQNKTRKQKNTLVPLLVPGVATVALMDPFDTAIA